MGLGDGEGSWVGLGEGDGVAVGLGDGRGIVGRLGERIVGERIGIRPMLGILGYARVSG